MNRRRSPRVVASPLSSSYFVAVDIELDVFLENEARHPRKLEIDVNAMRSGAHDDPAAECDRCLLSPAEVEAVLRAELARPYRRARLPEGSIDERETVVGNRRSVEIDT